MLDRDDKQVIKEAKAGTAVLVTWDRVLRKSAGGITPYEALDQAKLSGKGTPEAQAEVSRLRQLAPGDLTVLLEAGNKAVAHFRQQIEVNRSIANMIRQLRVEEDCSWRAVARFTSKLWGTSWGGNQIAGMVLCEKAAKLLGEDFMEPPWN
ncbi:MAG: hypothetical protein Q8O55_01610 [Dehalococcoidales bacterium]|nr:hypothetical protein [Dehalococcoidales bacterium]